jgi:hypothetical protein
MRKIENIFENLNEELCYDLMGELCLDEDRIIWSYNIDKHINQTDNIGISEDDVEIMSAEETLQDAHFHDMELINNYFHLLEDKHEWYFTEPTLNETTIISEIFEVDD